MRKLLLFGCIGLVGCTTVSETMNKEPEHTYTSQKSADALENCIGTALSSLCGPNTIRAENSRTLSFGIAMFNTATVTIIYGDPNTVQVRRGNGLKQKISDRVEGCL